MIFATEDDAAQCTLSGVVVERHVRIVEIEHRQGASIDDAMKMIAEAKARVAEKIKSQAIEAEIIE